MKERWKYLKEEVIKDKNPDETADEHMCRNIGMIFEIHAIEKQWEFEDRVW